MYCSEYDDQLYGDPIDFNNERCRICPMISPECSHNPCVMYGVPVDEEEKSDPQLMYETLKREEALRKYRST